MSVADAVKNLSTLTESVLGEAAESFRGPILTNVKTYQDAQTKLSGSSVSKRAKEVFATTDHPEAIALREEEARIEAARKANREKIAKAIAQIEAQLQPSVTDDDKKNIRAQRRVAQNGLVSYLDGLYHVTTKLPPYKDHPQREELTDAIRELQSVFDPKRKTKKAPGEGGSSRPRVQQITAKHTNGTQFTANNFSQLKQKTKLEVELLVEAWLKEAGQTDWRKVTEPTTFAFGDYEVTVLPKVQEKKESAPETASENVTVPA